MKRYWARWYADPRMGALDTWPHAMQVWESGIEEEWLDRIMVGIVDAESKEAAEALVLSCYEEEGCELDFCNEVEPDWIPGDRFPGGLTQAEQAEATP